ncbi:MAG: hypothetical protein IIB44_12990 [Candidatus Marinimicrobia bacterium]|nr:hypothetical protein [Candidatus Neomarinimicrobiota bacterium]
MEIYLNTDEFEEITNSFELLANQADQLDDVYQWKWVILSMHSTLQGFMVIGLRDSAGLNILKDKIAQKWLRAYRSGDPLPVEKLDTFLNLYKKIKSNRMIRLVFSRKYEPSADSDRSIKMLNMLRNKFIHFIPGGWLLEVSGLPKICLDCIEIIEFLGWKSGNVLWHKNELEVKCKTAIEKCKHIFNDLHHKYNNDQNT